MLPARRILSAAALLLLAACSSVKQGVVVAKHARSGGDGPPPFFQPEFRATPPAVCWIEVEGLDRHGRKARRSVLLFRADWEKIRVGDHWAAGCRHCAPRGCGK